MPVCTIRIRVRVELHGAVKQITQLHFKEEIPAKKFFAWSPSKKNVKPTNKLLWSNGILRFLQVQIK